MADRECKNGMDFHQLKHSKVFNSPIILEKDDRTTGVIGWIGLVAIIVLYDYYAIKTKKVETLTRSFWRHTENKIGQSIFIGAWLGLTFHLLFEKIIRLKVYNKDT